jgi:hypothetical protein
MSSSVAPTGQEPGHPATSSASRSSVVRPILHCSARRCDRRLQHQGGVSGGVGLRGELDLAVAQDHSGRHGTVRFRHHRLDGTAPVLVAQPCDGPAGGRDVGHHVVGAAPTASGRSGVLVLQTQHVAGTIRCEMQRHSGAHEDVVRTVEFDDVLGDQVEPCCLRPPQRLDVAEPTVTVLQVGLEPVCHVAGRVLAHPHPVAELCEVTRPIGAPQVETLRDHLRGQLVVAGQWPRRDQGGGGVEVGPGQIELLVDPSDGVAEFHTRIPERVPDGAGDRLDLLGDLLRLHVVDQQEIEVALRCELAASVAADRQQRHPACSTLDPSGRIVEDVDHPVVGDLGQRPAELPARTHDCTDLVDLPDSNCGRHGATSAAGSIHAGLGVSADVEASRGRTSSVEAIRRS